MNPARPERSQPGIPLPVHRVSRTSSWVMECCRRGGVRRGKEGRRREASARGSFAVGPIADAKSPHHLSVCCSQKLLQRRHVALRIDRLAWPRHLPLYGMLKTRGRLEWSRSCNCAVGGSTRSSQLVLLLQVLFCRGDDHSSASIGLRSSSDNEGALDIHRDVLESTKSDRTLKCHCCQLPGGCRRVPCHRSRANQC